VRLVTARPLPRLLVDVHAAPANGLGIAVASAVRTLLVPMSNGEYCGVGHTARGFWNFSSADEVPFGGSRCVIDRFLPVGIWRCCRALELRMKPAEPPSSSNAPERAHLAEGEEEAMPLPAKPTVVFLGGICLILMLAALYIAAEIVWPLVFAFVLSLLLNPLLRFLDRLHVPRVLGALLLVAAVLALVVGLGTAVSGPAASWAAKLPDGLPHLFQRLRFLETPFAALQHFWQRIENFAGWQTGTNSPGSAFLATLLTGTRSFASGFFTTLLFLFFLLVAGEIFLQRLVEIMPRFGSKRQVVDIANQIESDISAYLLTITAMNAAVGIATAAVMWLTGVGDPALWGTVAFLLNFVPILGPMLGVFPARRRTCRRKCVADASPGRTLPRHPPNRGRDIYADAACQAFHAQSGPGNRVSSSLVLDVGCSRRDTIRANTGNNKDRLRPCATVGGVWPLLGRLKLFAPATHLLVIGTGDILRANPSYMPLSRFRRSRFFTERMYLRGAFPKRGS